MPAPSGYVVDFDNPEKRTGAIYGIYVIWVIGLVFSCASVAQRFYVKAFIRNKLGFDDGSSASSYHQRPRCLAIVSLAANCCGAYQRFYSSGL